MTFGVYWYAGRGKLRFVGFIEAADRDAALAVAQERIEEPYRDQLSVRVWGQPS